MGIAFAGGPTWVEVDRGGFGGGSGTFGGILFALKAGVLLHRAELGVELAPVTFLPATDGEPTLEAQGYGGYHLDVSDKFAWPLRAGVGIVAINTNYQVWFQGRFDLVGVSFIADPVLVDFYLPTFRIASNFADPSRLMLTWAFGMGVAVLP